MEVYETDEYPLSLIIKFEQWLDEHIGTEYERNSAEHNKYYLVIFDLTHSDIKRIREFENDTCS